MTKLFRQFHYYRFMIRCVSLRYNGKASFTWYITQRIVTSSMNGLEGYLPLISMHGGVRRVSRVSLELIGWLGTHNNRAFTDCSDFWTF